MKRSGLSMAAMVATVVMVLSIRFPGNLYNRQNQNDPRDYIEAAWYIRQDGEQHLKKDYIRHHQRTHTPGHPAPAPEYL